MKQHPMAINTNTRMRWEVIRHFPELQNLNKKKILDIGAGLGYFSLQFVQGDADVLAVDVDRASLDYLFQQYGVATRYINIEQENLTEGEYDLIFVGEVLEHVIDPLGLLEKSYYGLKKGGQILLSTPAMEGPLIHTKGKQMCHEGGSEEHMRKGFYYHELNSYFKYLNMKIVRHSYCIYSLSDIFMQMTKLGFVMKKKKYQGQSDVLDKVHSFSYKILRSIYPLLLMLFKAEQYVCHRLPIAGHCHIFLASKVD